MSERPMNIILIYQLQIILKQLDQIETALALNDVEESFSFVNIRETINMVNHLISLRGAAFGRMSENLPNWLELLKANISNINQKRYNLDSLEIINYSIRTIEKVYNIDESVKNILYSIFLD